VHPARDEDVDGLAVPSDLREAALAVLASPNVAEPRWITEQYDALVGHANRPFGQVAGIDDLGRVALPLELPRLRNPPR
jgi:phosphoribosylformylglycinamidine (FGAM) synthase-like enzyme